MAEGTVCVVCAQAGGDWTVVRRARALELLARIERPDGLSNDDTLRLGAWLLAMTESGSLAESGGSGLRCDAVIEAAATDGDRLDGTSV